MDTSQIVLIVIIVLGLALAAGAVILVSGGALIQPRAKHDDTDDLNDEDVPPPEGAWKPSTWYSNATDGTLFPNQPSPSFRLSADTSFHRAIARRESEDRAANEPTIPDTTGEETDTLVLAHPPGTTSIASRKAAEAMEAVEARETASATTLTSETAGEPAAAQELDELEAQPTIPMSALAQPLPKAKQAKSTSAQPDPVTLIPTSPLLLPPSFEHTPAPLATPERPEHEEQPLAKNAESAGDTAKDTIVMAPTLPVLPAMPQPPYMPADAAAEMTATPIPALDSATTEEDEQPTFTALPTMPMMAAPAKDDLPPTIKLRSIRRAQPTVPLPEDTLELAAAAPPTENAQQETMTQEAEQGQQDEQNEQDEQDEQEAEEIETAQEAAELTELPTGAGALPIVPTVPPEETTTEQSEQPMEVGRPERAKQAERPQHAEQPEQLEQQETTDSALEEIATQPLNHPTTTAMFAPVAPSPSMQLPPFAQMDEPDEPDEQFDTAGWPALIQSMALAEEAQPLAPDQPIGITEPPAAMPSAFSELFTADALEELSERLPLPVSLETVEAAASDADSTDMATTPASEDAAETEEQRHDRLMVEAYSEVIQVRHDDRHDVVLVSFAGCPVSESADVAWVFKAIGRKMQDLMPPGKWRQYPMIFDLADLELAPQAEATWHMVLDAFVTHACPEVARGVALAAQYNSLHDATDASPSQMDHYAGEKHHPLATARSYDDALRIIEERRATGATNQE